MNLSFFVWASRSNGETVFLVQSGGDWRMVPAAMSLAIQFPSRREANQAKRIMASRFAGLSFHSCRSIGA